MKSFKSADVLSYQQKNCIFLLCWHSGVLTDSRESSEPVFFFLVALAAANLRCSVSIQLDVGFTHASGEHCAV